LLTDLRQVIAMTAPAGMIEQHHEFAQWAQAGVDKRVRACYTANAHQSSLAYRHHLVAQRAAGSKIAIHQHGGGYGIDADHLGEFHDIDRSDVFFTWGWSRPELGTRVRVMPTAPPARAKGKPSDSTLLMSLPVTKEFYRFQPFLLPSHVERAASETLSFVQAVSEHTHLSIRSSSAGPFPLDDLRGARAKITVDDLTEPGAMAASRARLVVHNYLGTSWLETLAMNVPTVCFYDPRLYEPRQSARPYFDILARVGVLHHSGLDAARFVNDFRGDPSSWWNSAEVQEAREAFVARYANFSDNWLEAWQTEFESLLAE
jgi:putative transferase (TIGR04331 family)